MSLLLDDRPLVIQPSLAKKLGNLNEAVFLQQLHYWIEQQKQLGRNYIEGRYWIYNSLEKWLEQFPWMAKSTLRRTIESLMEKGYIIKGNYNRRPMDHTAWYTVDYEKIQTLNKECVEEREKNARAALEKTEQENAESLTPQGADRSVQNEHFDLLKSAHRSVQNEHIEVSKMNTSICPNWTDRSVQNEHVDVSKMSRAIPKSTTENTTEITTIERASPARVEKEEVLLLYRECCSSFPRAVSWSPKRERLLCALVQAGYGLPDIREVFLRAEASDYLSGRSGGWDRADLEWLLALSNFVNVLEGKYDNASPRKQRRMEANRKLEESIQRERMQQEPAGEIETPWLKEALRRHPRPASVSAGGALRRRHWI